MHRDAMQCHAMRVFAAMSDRAGGEDGPGGAQGSVVQLQGHAEVSGVRDRLSRMAV